MGAGGLDTTNGFKLARARELLADGHTGAALAVLDECEADVADHARVSEAELRLEQAPVGHVRLAVSDDGRGFDPSRVRGGGYGFGLTVMAERVESLGGRLTVRAREEGGTMVEACIPGPPRSTGGPPQGRPT